MKVHLSSEFNYNLDEALATELYYAILNFEVMPSMRALMTAGKAASRDSTCAYNCSYVAVDDPKAFDEAMHILMCGTGVGFSVERQYVTKLPEIPDELFDCDTLITVKDSKEGWSKAFRQLIALLYSGEIPKWDLSKLRPAGARLKVFGGRSSGPLPLDELFKFTVHIFRGAIGRKLTSLECHDIMCKIGETIVVGGVRRCLLGNCEVFTETGIQKMQDLSVGTNVLTHDGTYKPIIAKEMTGHKEIWKIKTNIGELYSTKEHRWAVMRSDNKYDMDWTETQHLDSGMRLRFNDEIVGGKYQDFPEGNLDLPKLDADSAWFVGYFQGNGSCSSRYRNDRESFDNKWRVSYPVNEHGLENKVCEQFLRFVPKFSIYLKGSYGKFNPEVVTSKEIISSKGDITKYFLDHVKQPNESINVPAFILENTVEIRAAFIAGLVDSDGSVKDNYTKKIVVVSTKYKEFAKQIQLLCSSLGVVTRLRKKERVGKSTEYVVNTVNTKYADRLINVINEYSIKISNNENSHENNKDVLGLSFSQQQLKNSNKTHNNPYMGIHLYEKKYDEIQYVPVTVESIEFSHYEDTWDIEVNGNHNFYADGVLTHNSAMISLSNLSDDRMRHAKSGAWWEANPQRALSNNSAAYTEKPDVGMFMEEWLSLYNSKSGERGIFNREASKKVCEKIGRRDSEHEWGTNPCSEIILRPNQFCNLTECVVRADDDEKSLTRKVELATILGTFQATLTNFPYLRKIWKRNTEEERLLGVSLTGIYDNKALNNYKNKELPELLSRLRHKTIVLNETLAEEIGIPPSAAITCVKPSGTVSQLVNAASGIHSRYAKYYIRRVRNDIKDPLTQHMIEHGVPFEPDVMNPQNVVFSFPQKAPADSITRKEISAIDHLNLWLVYQRHWCEHKPSVTISVTEEEWPMVGAFVWEYFDEISGVSFLPYDGGSYRQAPYEEIDKKTYDEMVKSIPTEIDWNSLIEHDDNIEGAMTLACSAAAGCEV